MRNGMKNPVGDGVRCVWKGVFLPPQKGDGEGADAAYRNGQREFFVAMAGCLDRLKIPPAQTPAASRMPLIRSMKVSQTIFFSNLRRFSASARVCSMTKSTMSGRNWCKRSKALTSSTGLSSSVWETRNSLPYGFLASTRVFLFAIGFADLVVELAHDGLCVATQGGAIFGKATAQVGVGWRGCKNVAHQTEAAQKVLQVFHGFLRFCADFMLSRRNVFCTRGCV